jgi:hypothetical protein
MQSRKKPLGSDDNTKSLKPNDPALDSAFQALIAAIKHADRTQPCVLVIAGPNGAGKDKATTFLYFREISFDSKCQGCG